MVVGQSKVSDAAAADVLPMRNVFAILFFVAVGMLFDYHTIIEAPMLVLGVLAIILLVKPLAALAIVAMMGIKDPGAIVVGYGPVGKTVTRLLEKFDINPVIIETNVDAVLELHGRGKQALFGDASRTDILRTARVDAAAYLSSRCRRRRLVCESSKPRAKSRRLFAS